MLSEQSRLETENKKTFVGKYSFVTRTIELWNQLSADALGILL
jgi:hypothetical protein